MERNYIYLYIVYICLMNRTVVLLISDTTIKSYSTLTRLCKDNKEFSYSYLKSKKFPFTYKKYKFIKTKVL